MQLPLLLLETYVSMLWRLKREKMGLLGFGWYSNCVLDGRKFEPASLISMPAISRPIMPKGSGSFASGIPKASFAGVAGANVLGVSMMASPGAGCCANHSNSGLS